MLETEPANAQQVRLDMIMIIGIHLEEAPGFYTADIFCAHCLSGVWKHAREQVTCNVRCVWVPRNLQVNHSNITNWPIVIICSDTLSRAAKSSLFWGIRAQQIQLCHMTGRISRIFWPKLSKQQSLMQLLNLVHRPSRSLHVKFNFLHVSLPYTVWCLCDWG